MRFVLNIILALLQWYLFFLFDLAKLIWNQPASLMTWSTVWPHLVVLLVIMKTVMMIMSWILLFLRLVYMIMNKVLWLIKVICLILKLW
ncbi:TPA_asm: P' accessory protein [Bacopa monnieri virus 1]|uniref:P' accessory protein n=1 Tax=Bacopa monnieri virus 1 TaxID=2813287 RepID=A0AAD2KPQ1_9RHAB|nr:P' accessory protein [Bacopa monnieri virus 1]DAF42442.1 TPA_asm: P' accessory protein [Bacopa monnieri virus 1]